MDTATESRRRRLIALAMIAGFMLAISIYLVFAFRNLTSAFDTIGSGATRPVGFWSWAPTVLLVVGAVAVRFGLARLVPESSKSTQLEGRIDSLAASLKTAASIVDEVEAEISVRKRTLAQAQAEIARAQRELEENRSLALVEPDARFAVQTVLRQELSRSDRRGWLRDCVMLAAGILAAKLLDIAIGAIW